MDTVIPARTQPAPSTMKVHNPRKIWEAKEAEKKQMTRRDFEETSRERIGKRLDTMEAATQKLVDVLASQSEQLGLLQSTVEGLKERIDNLTTPKGKTPPKGE